VSQRLELGVNIDHVATLRQVRYRGLLHLPNVEPDLASAALLAEEGGADQITLHLRQDRRHIQDQDVWDLRERISTRLNLESGNTPEIIAIALEVKPHSVCLVPEHRLEITTEGGLDAAGCEAELVDTVRRCQDAGIRVSLFIDPEAKQVEAAARLRVDMVELHTGAFANAQDAAREAEIVKLGKAARLAHSAGLRVNAGHGLSTTNFGELFIVPYLRELNVGHHLVSRAIEVGLGRAVIEMRSLMDHYPGAE
jgi:pyridoxine 5-phosphate synthase